MLGSEACIKQISQKYEQLKECDNMKEKKIIAEELIDLCDKTEKELGNENTSSKLFRSKTQVMNIKKIAAQVIQDSNDQMNNVKRKFDVSSDSKEMVTVEQTSKQVVRAILEKEVTSKELKISAKEFEELAVGMEKNNAVMQEIHAMVMENGNDFNQVQKQLDIAYDLTVHTNEDLEEAANQQMKTRLTKIKLGITGLLSAIGYGILGIPGLILTGVVGLYQSFR